MSKQIIEQLNEIVASSCERLRHAQDSDTVEEIRIEVFGRKGRFPALSREMKDVSPEDRPQVGKAFNSAKNEIQQCMDEVSASLLAAADRGGQSEGIDVTLPGRRWDLGRKHPISIVIDDCVDIFRRMGFIVAEGPEIEDAYHNFDALNTPDDHPSRDTQDTFYFGDGRLLRTHTSPVQVRVMEKQDPPIRIVAPGRCYRRDTPDATHSMNFHQIEGLYIDHCVSLSDLKSALLTFAHELFGPDVGIQMRPHFFPFTEPSVEVDFSCIMCQGKGCRICKQSGWLEIAGAGMVDPNVLMSVGYDPEAWTGFAFGMGIERLAMLRYRISDIRYFYDNDVRFLEQFK